MGKNQLLGASKTFSCQVDKSSSIYLYLYTKIHIHMDLFQFIGDMNMAPGFVQVVRQSYLLCIFYNDRGE